MTNRFLIALEATDKYSKVFKDLNDKAAKTVKPLARMGQQFGALGKELHLDKAAAGIERLSAGASTLSRDLGLTLGPLESLFSVGRAGGIIGGLAVAGGAAIALGARFGSMGYEVSRTAQNLNVSADFLQRYRGAAKQAGVSSDALDGAVRGLGDSLSRAFYDGDARVQQTLTYLGIGLKKNADGSFNLEDALMGVSRAMAAYSDPVARRRIAEVFSIPEDAIPLLQLGERGMKALANQTAELGDVAGPKALAWATQFETSLNRLKVALEGVALRAGQNLIPKMPGWLDAATKAITPSAPDGAAPAAPRYPRGGTKPPPGLFDSVIDWWDGFDARARAASPRASHSVPSAAPSSGSVSGGAAQPAPQHAGPAPTVAGPNGADPQFNDATRYLSGPRDVARERAAFAEGQRGEQQSLRVDINFQNAPASLRTTVTPSSPAIQTRIGGTMNFGEQ